MKRRRLLAKVLVLVLFGAIMNVAVAWACAAWVSARDHGTGVQGWTVDPELPDGRHWMVMHWSAFGTTRVSTNTTGGNRSGTSDQRALFPAWCDLRATMRRSVEEARTAKPPPNPGPYPAFPMAKVAEARGWPLRTLHCTWDYGISWTGPPGGKALQTGIELTPRGIPRGGTLNTDDQRALPVQIIWPGFAVNAIFYAIVLWLLLLLAKAPFALRRRRRLRRGLCQRCGYDLRGGAHGACPECGALIGSPVGENESVIAEG